ncbi:MAG TPA: DUF4158 domain-containing protein, partial [Mycobacterium sp.]
MAMCAKNSKPDAVPVQPVQCQWQPAESGGRCWSSVRDQTCGPARSLGGLVSTRDVFSGQELARLRGFPEISREELIRFFTLSAADEAFVRSMRRPSTVLG